MKGPRTIRPTFMAAGSYCALLTGAFLLRPLRDAYGMIRGPEGLPFGFIVVFAIVSIHSLVWSSVVSKLRKRSITKVGLRAFAVSLLAFWVLFQTYGVTEPLAIAFFIWGSVFSLASTSLFWSRMVDLHGEAEGRRHFPAVAAGGTVGAIAGPALAMLLLRRPDPYQLMPLSALLIELCVRLIPKPPRTNTTAALDANSDPPDSERMGGSWLAGVRPALASGYLRNLSLFVIASSVIGSLLYVQQGRLVVLARAATVDRARLLATMDLASNVVALVIQLFVTSAVIRRLGPARTLALIPLVGALGAAVLAWRPAVTALVAVQVTRRFIDYAFMRPARELFFTPLDAEQKYKSKPFVDVVAPRLGDALGASTDLICAGPSLKSAGMVGMFAAVALLALRNSGRNRKESNDVANDAKVPKAITLERQL